MRRAEHERLRAEGHERTDVQTRPLAILLAVAVVGAAVLQLALFGLFTLFTGTPVSPIGPFTALEQPVEPPPAPRLQAEPRQDLLALEATQTALLGSYGTNPATGRPRIPIERALDFVAANGLGAAPAPQPGATTGPASGAAACGQLFADLGCVGCHRMASGAVGPPLEGVFGSEVRLESGETVVADEEYLRRSILAPQEQIVAGYPPVMPSYAGRLSDEELTQLLDYIRSLADAEGAAP